MGERRDTLEILAHARVAFVAILGAPQIAPVAAGVREERREIRDPDHADPGDEPVAIFDHRRVRHEPAVGPAIDRDALPVQTALLADPIKRRADVANRIHAPVRVVELDEILAVTGGAAHVRRHHRDLQFLHQILHERVEVRPELRLRPAVNRNQHRRTAQQPLRLVDEGGNLTPLAVDLVERVVGDELRRHERRLVEPADLAVRPLHGRALAQIPDKGVAPRRAVQRKAQSAAVGAEAYVLDLAGWKLRSRRHPSAPRVGEIKPRHPTLVHGQSNQASVRRHLHRLDIPREVAREHVFIVGPQVIAHDPPVLGILVRDVSERIAVRREPRRPAKNLHRRRPDPLLASVREIDDPNLLLADRNVARHRQGLIVERKVRGAPTSVLFQHHARRLRIRRVRQHDAIAPRIRRDARPGDPLPVAREHSVRVAGAPVAQPLNVAVAVVQEIKLELLVAADVAAEQQRPLRPLARPVERDIHRLVVEADLPPHAHRRVDPVQLVRLAEPRLNQNAPPVRRKVEKDRAPRRLIEPQPLAHRGRRVRNILEHQRAALHPAHVGGVRRRSSQDKNGGENGQPDNHGDTPIWHKARGL